MRRAAHGTHLVDRGRRDGHERHGNGPDLAWLLRAPASASRPAPQQRARRSAARLPPPLGRDRQRERARGHRQRVPRRRLELATVQQDLMQALQMQNLVQALPLQA